MRRSCFVFIFYVLILASDAAKCMVQPPTSGLAKGFASGLGSSRFGREARSKAFKADPQIQKQFVIVRPMETRKKHCYDYQGSKQNETKDLVKGEALVRLPGEDSRGYLPVVRAAEFEKLDLNNIENILSIKDGSAFKRMETFYFRPTDLAPFSEYGLTEQLKKLTIDGLDVKLAIDTRVKIENAIAKWHGVGKRTLVVFDLDDTLIWSHGVLMGQIKAEQLSYLDKFISELLTKFRREDCYVAIITNGDEGWLEQVFGSLPKVRKLVDSFVAYLSTESVAADWDKSARKLHVFPVFLEVCQRLRGNTIEKVLSFGDDPNDVTATQFMGNKNLHWTTPKVQLPSKIITVKLPMKPTNDLHSSNLMDMIRYSERLLKEQKSASYVLTAGDLKQYLAS